jgi:hypothetical protein
VNFFATETGAYLRLTRGIRRTHRALANPRSRRGGPRYHRISPGHALCSKCDLDAWAGSNLGDGVAYGTGDATRAQSPGHPPSKHGGSKDSEAPAFTAFNSQAEIEPTRAAIKDSLRKIRLQELKQKRPYRQHEYVLWYNCTYSPWPAPENSTLQQGLQGTRHWGMRARLSRVEIAIHIRDCDPGLISWRVRKRVINPPDQLATGRSTEQMATAPASDKGTCRIFYTGDL